MIPQNFGPQSYATMIGKISIDLPLVCSIFLALYTLLNLVRTELFTSSSSVMTPGSFLLWQWAEKIGFCDLRLFLSHLTLLPSAIDRSFDMNGFIHPVLSAASRSSSVRVYQIVSIKSFGCRIDPHHRLLSITRLFIRNSERRSDRSGGMRNLPFLIWQLGLSDSRGGLKWVPSFFVAFFFLFQELTKFINQCNEVKAATMANKEGGQLGLVKVPAEPSNGS